MYQYPQYQGGGYPMAYPQQHAQYPMYQQYSQNLGKEVVLYIGDLEPSITHEIIYHYLIQFGIISNLRLMYDAQTNRSRGFAFVTYANQQDGCSLL